MRHARHVHDEPEKNGGDHEVAEDADERSHGGSLAAEVGDSSKAVLHFNDRGFFRKNRAFGKLLCFSQRIFRQINHLGNLPNPRMRDGAAQDFSIQAEICKKLQL